MPLHAYTHLGGSVVLFGLSAHLPDAGSVIAGLAGAGLFLSGLAQLLKQSLDVWHARAALVGGKSCAESQPLADLLGCPFGPAARAQCAAARQPPAQPKVPGP